MLGFCGGGSSGATGDGSRGSISADDSAQTTVALVAPHTPLLPLVEPVVEVLGLVEARTHGVSAQAVVRDRR